MVTYIVSRDKIGGKSEKSPFICRCNASVHWGSNIMKHGCGRAMMQNGSDVARHSCIGTMLQGCDIIMWH
jgi:hypothetical protein